ncbi:MAG TPA: molybdenum cofactor guanylyltransferase MobA [Sulfuricurvum sp.]|nr:MAG: molybdenum cofactor guanylyltransferase [Campylobacterales bacterium 16-40-21]OZA01877.1 MAG: molybdenum cofactor guanylyltransferase [Sulfuricurvum sp. 17-40-25]HQS67548.1 molybdenum cofactor guanylyltransferase MobA [Sulfuricurvum sp.]HQT37113.1 molybdenum cofactor guanylyltransferase MobA [Sulfuricurvum sp.]
MFDIPCILFAGGKSSRMGQDKSLLPFGEYSSITQYQYERLSKLFTHVYISTKTADKFDFDANFILDPLDADFAPTAGFVGAFEQLQCARIFVLSVDSPFVDEETIKKLVQADKPDYDAVIAKTPSGTHPMVGIYHLSLLDKFSRMLREGDHRLGKLLTVSNTHYVEFGNEELFMNLNHPHEYHDAISCLKP